MKLKEVADLFSGVGVQTTRQSTRLFHGAAQSDCLELEEMGSPKVQALAFLKAGEFGKAVECISKFGVHLRGCEWDSVIEHFSKRSEDALQSEDMRAYKRNQRRIGALIRFRDSGLDPDSLVPPVELEEGYRGKILLVSVSGGVIRRPGLFALGRLRASRDSEEYRNGNDGPRPAQYRCAAPWEGPGCSSRKTVRSASGERATNSVPVTRHWRPHWSRNVFRAGR